MGKRWTEEKEKTLVDSTIVMVRLDRAISFLPSSSKINGGVHPIGTSVYVFMQGSICEGPADRAIIEAILAHYFDDYVSIPIQPPTGMIGGNAGLFGGGWKGVKAWCQSEIAARDGFKHVAILENADFIVIQVDADILTENEINTPQPCPPPTQSTNQVHALILSWLQLTTLPDKVILCVPCMASETWALVALWPSDGSVSPCNPPIQNGPCVECRTDIKMLLRRLGAHLNPKLVVSQDGKLKNQARGYQAPHVQENITNGWNDVLTMCSEASRFDTDLRSKIP